MTSILRRISLTVILLFSFICALFGQEAVIINKTGFDIYNIYASPAGAENWSDDLQPHNVILKDGYQILNLSSYKGETLFDFRFIDVDGDEYIKKNVDLNLHRKVVVTLDDLSYLQNTEKSSSASSDDWSVSIRNNSGITITELYISPHNSNSWGGNLIENDYMENKTTRSFFMNNRPEGTSYDIRIDGGDSVFIRDDVILSNNITVVISSSDRE